MSNLINVGNGVFMKPVKVCDGMVTLVLCDKDGADLPKKKVSVFSGDEAIIGSLFTFKEHE